MFVSVASGGGHGTCMSSSAAAGPVPGASMPLACRTHSGSAPSGAGLVLECSVTERFPLSSGAPTVSWSRTSVSVWTASGARRTSSVSRVQPSRAPAHSARSSRAVPGRIVRPSTSCSASHGWVRGERPPVNTAPRPSASSTATCSSGWPGSPAGRGRVCGSASGQNRCRWKA